MNRTFRIVIALVAALTPLVVRAQVQLVSIEVTPSNPTIPAGRTQQFTATGTFSDDSIQDVTATCTWSSDSASVASVSNAPGSTGLATGNAPGTTQITATSGAVFNSTTLTVTDAILLSIEVMPINPTISAGNTQQFTASGIFSDGSHQDVTTTCTWSSDSASVASVSNAPGSTGLATGNAPGTTQITATSGAVFNSTTLTVTAPPLPSFTISVSPSTVKQGGKVTVTANYSNPTSTAVTLTLKVSLVEPKSKTLMGTFPLTLNAGQTGNVSFPITVRKSVKVGLYSLTVDVYLGSTQIGSNSAQLTVTK